MRLLQQVHMQEKVKLIEFKHKLMNCANFQGRNLLMRYEVCSLQG
jgi:hypothetical protein